jgi:hypothetical protein
VALPTPRGSFILTDIESVERDETTHQITIKLSETGVVRDHHLYQLRFVQHRSLAENGAEIDSWIEALTVGQAVAAAGTDVEAQVAAVESYFLEKEVSSSSHGAEFWIHAIEASSLAAARDESGTEVVRLTPGASGFGLVIADDGEVLRYTGEMGPRMAARLTGAVIEAIDGAAVSGKDEILATLLQKSDAEHVDFTLKFLEPLQPTPGQHGGATQQPEPATSTRQRVEKSISEKFNFVKAALVEAAQAAPATPEEAKRLELSGLSVKELRARAKHQGATVEQLEQAAESETPRDFLVAVLFHLEKDPADKLRDELQALPVKDLRARAKAAGATAEQLEHAADSDFPRNVLLELLLQLELPPVEPELQLRTQVQFTEVAISPEEAVTNATVAREAAEAGAKTAHEAVVVAAATAVAAAARAAEKEEVAAVTAAEVDEEEVKVAAAKTAEEETKASEAKAVEEEEKATTAKASELERVQTELAPMTLKQLKKKARADGIDEAAIEAVDDSDEPKVDIIAILVDFASVGVIEHAAAAAASAVRTAADAKVAKEAVASAAVAKATAAAVAKAAEAEAKTAVAAAKAAEEEVQAVAATVAEEKENMAAAKTVEEEAKSAAAKVAELDRVQDLLERVQAEVAPMSLRALKKKALADGIDEETVDAVDDSDEPRNEILALLLEAARAGFANTEVTAAAVVDSESDKPDLEPEPELALEPESEPEPELALEPEPELEPQAS